MFLLLLEFLDSHELKKYFKTHFSYLYYLFYESFCGIENEFKLKGKSFYSLYRPKLKTFTPLFQECVDMKKISISP